MYHLLRYNSPSLTSELQDTSSVESVQIEFIDESEEPMEINKPSPTDVFSSYHEYDLFLLQKEINAPNGNLNHQDTHNCENQDDILIHATILSHTIALPQFMAEHNCEDLEHVDDPSTVPTAVQATSDQTFIPWCAHHPMETQCNQSQYHNHNLALPQFMATPNSEELEPTDNPSAVPITLQASCDYTFNLKFALNLLETQWNQPHEPLPVLAADDPVTCASFTKGSGISHLDGWKRFKNLAKRDKHDLSCIASPNGETTSPFSSTTLFKSHHSSTLCLVNLHLETSTKLNCGVVLHQALYVTVHLQSSIKKISFVSPYRLNLMTLLYILELHSCHN